MPIHDVIRDAPFGQLMRLLSKNRLFQYPEEKPDFKLPNVWLEAMNGTTDTPSSAPSTSADSEKPQQPNDGVWDGSTAVATDIENAPLEKRTSQPVKPKSTEDGVILVDWYATDDPANPHNWSNLRRGLLGSLIFFYTLVIYMTSSLYTSSTEDIIQRFGVSNLKATLSLSIYVLGYGVGPLLFSPLSEIARIGRSPVYIITMILFVAISIPTALVNNFAGLIVLRFFQAFFGSPCLASGGATMSDMYSMLYLPFAIIAWVAAAFCGPAIGPIISGFAVPAESWRWSLYESIWASSPVLIAMFFLLPETSTPTLLLHRAQRLRKLTGNNKFMAQSEIDRGQQTALTITVDALNRRLEITVKDPAILFVQIYTAIVYGIYDSYFEVFPLVYHGFYGMNLGETGLVFLCITVGCLLACTAYASLLYFIVVPQIKKSGMGPQEGVLLPGVLASVGPIIGLFMFSWTARESIHWIVPTIGIAIYAMGVFIVFQCVFLYIPLSYAQYTSSLFAANDFFRSALACGSVLFAHPLFNNLGVAKGVSVLGGLSVIGVIGMGALVAYGARLRAMSRFAVS